MKKNKSSLFSIGVCICVFLFSIANLAKVDDETELKAKCPPVANHLGVKVGDLVCKYLPGSPLKESK